MRNIIFLERTFMTFERNQRTIRFYMGPSGVLEPLVAHGHSKLWALDSWSRVHTKEKNANPVAVVHPVAQRVIFVMRPSKRKLSRGRQQAFGCRTMGPNASGTQWNRKFLKKNKNLFIFNFIFKKYKKFSFS